MSKDTVHARIRLKNDTEANWNKSNFIPLKGEPIIYSADGVHPFFRLKIGDGETPITDLPFIYANMLGDIDFSNIVAKRVEHTLTFGAGGIYQFDGSQDVTVPVYTGNII